MVDTLSLAGKVAIVTGSGRENGIGAAVAAALARNGAAVTINYVSDSSAERAANVAKKIEAEGGKAIVVKAAVDKEGAAVLAKETLKAFNTDHIDILVNNAGTGYYVDSLEISEEQLRETFEVNVFGTLYVTQAVIPHMPSGGRIINITSIASKLGPSVLALYGSSKAAVDSLTYSWASEFGRSKGITVNSVAPGPVATDLAAVAGSNPRAQELAGVYLGMTRAEERIGTTDDIADAVLLLTSEKGRWITGQHVSVSGGITGN